MKRDDTIRREVIRHIRTFFNLEFDFFEKKYKFIFKDYFKAENLKIIGGIMEEEPLTMEEVANIATLPTLDEARSKIVGILKSPAQKIMSILLAPGSKIAILAHAKSKKT